MKRINRLRITIQGAVQGVGFRPFIFRLAQEMGLAGWVLNSAQGVFIEVEGEKRSLDRFMLRIQEEKPGPAYIQSFEASFLDSVGYNGFSIRHSRGEGKKTVLVLPDIATCPECLAEIFDPGNRRYRYPFTNCTLCGPRYSIIRTLPYDRPHTTMERFRMCSFCEAEYQDPGDRRFHAQPNACPDCGPQLAAWDRQGRVVSNRNEALLLAVANLRAGKIVALKGIGGFQLLVDAGNTDAINRLRHKKKRNEKPFAILMDTIAAVKAVCRLDPLEQRVLLSAEAPIVILERKELTSSIIAPAVAPGNPTLGVMLPCSPLHHILMSQLKCPVVATSGNISDEPICIEEAEALQKLGNIADLFLVHDRPIARHVDDSVVRVVMGREMMIRRSRGYAPLPITLKHENNGVIAVGAHQKSTVALQVGKNAFVSQHIGDLETEESVHSFQEAIDSLCRLYDVKPTLVVCDQHPDYQSTRYAKSAGIPLVQIQHHHAHICACMAENQLAAPVLGIAWDGTGYGPDQTVWGGEFLLVTESGYQQVIRMRSFRLPGSTKAIKEPRRSALGVLYEIFGRTLLNQSHLCLFSSFGAQELRVLVRMLETGFNSPRTTSIGRLFDAVAAIIDLRQLTSFEGQAAMELEFAMNGLSDNTYYAVSMGDTIDWAPMILELLEDLQKGVAVGRMALKFHNCLAEIIVQVAKMAGVEKVALSGGCFQNRYLTERAISRLEMEGFRGYWHQRLPPNDGGISVGQLFAVNLAQQLDP
ncbi:MAG: carbamoyltransferase HypF [bacterium]